MARLGARILRLEATRPTWRDCRFDPETLSPQAREALAAAYGAAPTPCNIYASYETLRNHVAAAQGPDGLNMTQLSDADLEALVALGEDFAL